MAGAIKSLVLERAEFPKDPTKLFTAPTTSISLLKPAADLRLSLLFFDLLKKEALLLT